MTKFHIVGTMRVVLTGGKVHTLNDQIYEVVTIRFHIIATIETFKQNRYNKFQILYRGHRLSFERI